jgi:hypothetical protein
MVAKEVSVKKYGVRLSADEREQLEALIREGKSAAQRLLKARILLKADVSPAGEGWSDSRIIKALETSPSMVYRVRKQLVEDNPSLAHVAPLPPLTTRRRRNGKRWMSYRCAKAPHTPWGKNSMTQTASAPRIIRYHAPNAAS